MTKPRLLDLDGAELEKEIQRLQREHSPTRRTWTPKQIQLLRRLYGHVDVRILAPLLDHTADATLVKASRLGLKFSEPS